MGDSKKDCKTEKITDDMIKADSRFYSYYILVDYKEQELSKQIRIKNPFKYPAIITNLFRGDFGIFYMGKLLFMIERKTWQDLNASFRDGRVLNKQKLLDARDKTGATIFYFIEGKKPRNAKINFAALQAHLDHIILRDNIHVIYTANFNATIDRINILIQNYSTVKEFHSKLEISDVKFDPETGTTIQSDSDESIGGKTRKENDNVATDTDILQMKEEKSLEKIKHELFQAIPGVSNATASIMMENFKFKKILRYKTQVNDLAMMKYPGGAIIGATRARKILYPFMYAKDNLDKYQKTYIKIISAIPGISVDSAKTILKAIPFYELIRTHDEARIASIQGKKMKIGIKKAKNIITYVRI